MKHVLKAQQLGRGVGLWRRFYNNNQSCKYLKNGCDWASGWRFNSVSGRSKQENRNRDEYCKSGDSKTPLPSFVIFHPHHQSYSNQSSTWKTEDEVVEECRSFLPSFKAGLIKLLSPMRRKCPFYPSNSKCHHVKPCK